MKPSDFNKNKTYDIIVKGKKKRWKGDRVRNYLLVNSDNVTLYKPEPKVKEEAKTTTKPTTKEVDKSETKK